MTATTTRAAQIRSQLSHPILDADGHMLEIRPVFVDFLRETCGEAMADRYTSSPPARRFYEPWHFSDDERRESWIPRNNLWGFPTRNTLDRATAVLPRLYAERMDDLGIDFSILYPSEGLFVATIEDDDVRNACSEAYNGFVAELCAPLADRVKPVATIPMRTPEEAIHHLEIAVNRHGLKVVCMPGFALRPLPVALEHFPEHAGLAARLDYYALDSEYDYDPVWRKCLELGVAPTFHSATGNRLGRSISNYTFNHIGAIAQSQEALAKALFLGGVTRRFPELRFGFLECGAAWACSLYSELVGHWHKRSLEGLAEVDPEALDRKRLMEFIEKYGDPRTLSQLGPVQDYFRRPWQPLPERDDFHRCRIESEEDIRDLFIPRFYVGCEADDRSVAWAFDSRIHPLGEKIRVMFGSDIGHWDVVDVGEVVEEAYEHLEHGLIGEADFAALMFENAVRLHTAGNADFFRGTRIEREVESLLAAS